MHIVPMKYAIPEDPILAAAHAVVMDVGVRRTTISAVAKRAGVGRPTVYRRYSNVRDLLRALITAEFADVMMRVAATAEVREGTMRERLVLGAVEGVESLALHPIQTRVLKVDPELMLPYVTSRVGTSQRAAIAAFTDYIRRGQEEGSVRPGDAADMAATLELSTRAYIWFAHSMSKAERKAATGQFVEMFDRYLAP